MSELKRDVKWFGYLCVDRGIISTAICRQVALALGERLDLLLFAETLLANDFCFNRERLQAIINDAWHRDQAGEDPPVNIFVDDLPAEDTREAAVASRKRKSIPFQKKAPEEEARPAAAAASAEAQPAPEKTVKQPKKTVLKSIPMSSPVNEAISPETVAGAEAQQESESRTGKELPKPKIRTEPAAEAETLPSPEAQPQPQPSPEAAASAPKAQPQEAAASQAAAARERIQVPATSTVTLTRPPKAPTLIDLNIEVYQGDIFDFATIADLTDTEVRDAMVRLLLAAQDMGASDLHLSADARPFVRRSGQIEYLSDYVLTAADSERLNIALLTDEQAKYFRKKQDYDFALALDENRRYRINLMDHKDGPAGTYRLIPAKIRSLEELGFQNAETIRGLLSYHNGLILVTGPVGAGKTTTLASLVDELNRERQDHIVTVENPIEIVQRSKSCNITQREVGRHTKSFKTALKGALREDPDIIVIGELRDLETIEMAITASETGHLVIGTLHTADAATTLNRLLDVFPPEQQPQIRAMVAESLRGIICQRLLPDVDGKRVVACELLLNNVAVGNLIREGKTHALKAVLETGAKQGMCMMDNYILSLWQADRITDQVAQLNIRDRGVRNRIKSQKQFGSAGAQSVQTVLPGDNKPKEKKKWGLFS